MTHFV